MIKINLEQELLKQNRRLTTPKELLFINEFERNAGLENNDALRRVGLTGAIRKGAAVSAQVRSLMDESMKFSQGRVFHISQIQALCEKYYLRFLPTEYYAGAIDKELPTKITNFEAAFMVKCSQSNTRICAPRSSFKLKERPKDPLLFYRINEEYFYLIHKWGGDLNLSNRLRSIFSGGLATRLILLFIGVAILCCGIRMGGQGGIIILSVVMGVITFGVLLNSYVEDWAFIDDNDWMSDHV
jgi:hypothetical protein